MHGSRYGFAVFVVAILLCLVAPLSAQGDVAGSLTVGQPVISTIGAETPVARYEYTAAEPQLVRLQAFGETAQPTLSVTQEGEVVASEPNAGGQLTIALEATLLPGDYVIEVGAANATGGLVVLVLQEATPLPMTELQLSTPASGEISMEMPPALYHLSGASEPSILYIESGLADGGMVARLINEQTNSVSGLLSADLTGGRFRIPANGAAYRVQIEHGGTSAAVPYTLCWALASADGCGQSAPPALPPAATTATEAPAPQPATCTVSPAGSAVNVRASASTQSPIIASLSAGFRAEVIGISPDRFFYNIQFGGVNGWVAASVVTTDGDCTGVPAVQPPPFVALPTATPIPPTQPPMPTSPPMPTQPPLSPTPSGPCMLTVNSPVFVYTIPVAIVDYLQDQVQGGILTPVGRLADNSWWKTTHYDAWVQTGLFGGAITVSGDCSGLPIIAPS